MKVFKNTDMFVKRLSQSFKSHHCHSVAELTRLSSLKDNTRILNL